jgi:hypothetical protein
MYDVGVLVIFFLFKTSNNLWKAVHRESNTNLVNFDRGKDSLVETEGGCHTDET